MCGMIMSFSLLAVTERATVTLVSRFVRQAPAPKNSKVDKVKRKAASPHHSVAILRHLKAIP